jgi:hypothetical protein
VALKFSVARFVANDVDFTFAYTPAHELRMESASIAAYVWQPSGTASNSYTP